MWKSIDTHRSISLPCINVFWQPRMIAFNLSTLFFGILKFFAIYSLESTHSILLCFFLSYLFYFFPLFLVVVFFVIFGQLLWFSSSKLAYSVAGVLKCHWIRAKTTNLCENWKKHDPVRWKNEIERPTKNKRAQQQKIPTMISGDKRFKYFDNRCLHS